MTSSGQITETKHSSHRVTQATPCASFGATKCIPILRLRKVIGMMVCIPLRVHGKRRMRKVLISVAISWKGFQVNLPCHVVHVRMPTMRHLPLPLLHQILSSHFRGFRLPVSARPGHLRTKMMPMWHPRNAKNSPTDRLRCHWHHHHIHLPRNCKLV